MLAEGILRCIAFPSGRKYTNIYGNEKCINALLLNTSILRELSIREVTVKIFPIKINSYESMTYKDLYLLQHHLHSPKTGNKEYD